jgi:chitodextrinase
MSKLSKKYHNFFILRMAAILAASMLFSVGAIISIDITSMGAPSENIEWSVTLNFSETNGRTNYVVFGEAPDANDGPPVDGYDEPKPPVPMEPYIRAWFSDSLPVPYYEILSDYRKYPDTYKVWNLSVRWVPSDYVTCTSTTISWNTLEVDDSEYNSVILYDGGGNPLKDMLTQNSYSFTCPAMITQSFTIICEGLNNPPETPGKPSGETDGYHGTSYTYNTSTTDLDGDDISYFFNWGDGTNSGWIGPYANGEICSTSHVWQSPGMYNISVKAKDVYEEESGWSPQLLITMGNIAPTANASVSETVGLVDSLLTFNGSQSFDQDGYIKNWSWDFGDGSNETGEIVTHSYSNSGTYNVTLTVTDDDDAKDEDSITVVIITANSPPSNPIVAGETTGKKNVEYRFTAMSTDTDNDNISYIFDWGDGSTSKTELLPNGTSTMQNHTWTSPGIFIVSVYAEDENYAMSDNVELTVLIDVQYFDNIGHFIDSDSDGIYDLFYSNITGDKTVLGQKDGSYLIDSDGDGKWDYVYNQTTGTTTPFKEETIDEVPWTLIVVIVVALVIISVIVSFYKKGYF